MGSEMCIRDRYKQTKNRIDQLEITGHNTDKVEIIIMGGTFPSLTLDYQQWFVKRIFDALNGQESKYLEEAQKLNETANHRCVGLTFETRPDWCKESHIDRMLEMGATRVEVGVQNIYDFIYARVKRGHTVRDVIEATRLARDAGLKINYHMMPGLPGSDLDRDLRAFRKIFGDPDFRPDMVKIYPTLVLEGTELYEMYKRNEYRPYTTEEVVELIVKIKEMMPPWVRTMRIQRDIPAHLIVAGVKTGNLGELVYKELKRRGIQCRCIRCREAGHRYLKEGILPEKSEIIVRRYEAGDGIEYFISSEDREKDILLGYIRLRFPSENAHRSEFDSETAIVRELHVYGPVLGIGEKPVHRAMVQHRGTGRQLLGEAEQLSLESGYRRLLVISGVGVRNYYRAMRYEREGPYMVKKLRKK